MRFCVWLWGFVDSLKLWQEANNMAGSENDGAKKQTTDNDVKEEASIYEDEINLMDYFVVLCKR